jgi:predicted dehydrogenase
MDQMQTKSSETDVMQVAVVGVGRMGKHHARTYAKMPGVRLMAVVDADADRADTVAQEYGCAACASIEELLAKFPGVKAASIAVPTVHHAAAARPLLERKIACLIEKPLASSVAEAKQLAQFAGDCGVPVQVGHTERFNPAVRAVAALDITPRFVEVDRVSPMTFRSLDVGVVMDMMIHDLDIVLMLVDSPIKRVEATGVAVIGKHEDIANARLVFASGCVVNLTASRLALNTTRRMRVFSETAYVSLDYHKRTGIIVRRSDNDEALSDVRAQIERGGDLSDLDYSKLVTLDELKMDLEPGQDDPLTAELTSFLEAVRGRREPVVDAQAGYAAVEAAERVVAAINEHRWEGLAGVRL